MININKKQRIIILGVLFLFCGMLVGMVNAELVTHDLTLITTTNPPDVGDATTMAMQRKLAWSNDRFWIYYTTGTQMAYRSSADGITWTGATNIRLSNSGQVFAIDYSPASMGDFIAYVWGDKHHYDASDGEFRMGTHHANGSINWLAAESAYTSGGFSGSFQPVMTFTSDNAVVVASLDDYLGDTWVTKSNEIYGVPTVATVSTNYPITIDTWSHSTSPDWAGGNTEIWAIVGRYSVDNRISRIFTKSADLSNIPVDATIINATLYYYYGGDSGDGDSGTRAVDLHRVTENWSGTLTHNNQPAYNGTPSLNDFTFDGLGGLGWVGMDVTWDVQQFYDEALTNYGWVMKWDNEGEPDAAGILKSDNHGDTGDRPYVEVWYSATSDPGMWTTHSDFPYLLDDQNADDRGTWAQPLAVGSDGSFYVIWAHTGERAKGRFWNETSDTWSAEEFVTEATETITYSYKNCAVADQQGRIHFLYQDDGDSEISYVVRSAAGVWSSPIVLTDKAVWQWGEIPVISMGEYGSRVFVQYIIGTGGNYRVQVMNARVDSDTTNINNWNGPTDVIVDPSAVVIPLGLSAPRVSSETRMPVAYTWQDGGQPVYFSYYEIGTEPIVRTFAISDDTPTTDQVIFLGYDILNADGQEYINYTDFWIGDNITLRYNHLTDTFSEILDTQNDCTLDVDGSVATVLNATAIQVVYKIQLGEDFGLSPIDVNATAYDVEEIYGVGSKNELFQFIGPGITQRLTAYPLGTVYSDQWIWVNITIKDDLGIEDITETLLEVTLEGGELFVLKWSSVTEAFTETIDDNDLCTLDATRSTHTHINDTHIENSFYFKTTGGESGFVDFEVTSRSARLVDTVNIWINVYLYKSQSFIEQSDYLQQLYIFFGIADFMGAITGAIEGLRTYWTDALNGLVGLMVLNIRLVLESITKTTKMFTDMVNVVIQISTIVISILNGTHPVTEGVGRIGDIWEVINFNAWYLAVPIFALIEWFESLDKRAKVSGWNTTLGGDLGTIINILSFMTSTLSMLVTFVVDLIGRIAEAVLPNVGL